ncbi:MAG: ABC transporter [Rhodospirillaceae bacterium]|nr:ABC transporter [Rhodospirillaceae bacterium]
MNEAKSKTIVQLDNVCRSFQQGSRTIEVLKNISINVEAGESVGILGPSGSGKSTMLHIVGLLEPPDSGHVFLDGLNSSLMKDHDKTILRRKYLGFVYQFHHLLSEFSAIDNVILPQIIAGRSKKEARDRSKLLLEKVGLISRSEHKPGQLSGGEQQRIAIARALANKPKLIIADEPTGNLDMETAEKVTDVLFEILASEAVGAIVATHNPELVARLDHAFSLPEIGLGKRVS